MACPDANLIAAFLGGTLDPAQAEELAGHIDGCGACDELVAWSVRAGESTPPTTRSAQAGPAGRAGPAGLAGPADLAGPAGLAGSAGLTGPAVLAGPADLAGPAGLTGPGGDAGDGDGAGPRPRGSVFGRYVLLELVGSGGMGRVYAAFDPKLDRKVALKLVWDEAAAARAAIEREARLAARLQHPNVIAIYDVGAVGDRIYLAMEYVDGVTLADWITGSARTTREVLGVFLQAARGLAAAHAAGLVHRDFKPSNVLVGRDGRVRVLDFGLARAIDDTPDASAAHRREAAVAASRTASIAGSGTASITPSGTASIPASGTASIAASGTASIPASGTASIAASGTASIPASGTASIAASGTASIPASGTASITASGTASITASGTTSGTGVRIGSPAYMAPEQHRGERADAAADQFAFCVALHEALHGARPFAGSSLTELAGNVLAGRVADPPPGARVPPWLRRVVLRGLRVDPDERFASMDALATALGRDPTRVRRIGIALAALAGVAALGLAGHARTVHERAAACDAHEASVLALVGPGEAQRVRAAFAATGASFAAASADRSLAALDHYARELGRGYREACATGGPELEQRAGCYEERAAELGGLVGAFTGADRMVVARAISAVGALTPVATCEEAHAAARPDGAMPELALRAADARARFHAGRLAAATDEANRIIREARARGDRRHELDALLLLGHIEINESKPAAAATLAQAVELGEALGRDADVEVAFELLAFDSAQRMHDYAGAHRLQRLAAAKLLRTGRGDGRAGDVAALDGTILQMEGHLGAAEAALRQALALQEQIHGADNPVVTLTLDRLAMVLTDQGRDAEALALDERAAAIRDRTFGPEHPRLVDGLVDLGASLSAVGRHDEALARLRRADDIARRAFGAASAERFYALDNIGLVEKRRGSYDAAQAALEAARAIAQTALGPDSAEAGEVLADLGEVATLRGRPADGIALYQRALPIVEHALGRDHREVGELLLGFGRSYLELHQADLAVPLLERALQLRADEPPARLATVRFTLARALWDAATDRARAIALARQASEGSIHPGEGVTKAEISAWLALHAPPTAVR